MPGEIYRRFVRFCCLFVVVIESFFCLSILGCCLGLFVFVVCLWVVIESFLFVYSWLLFGFVCLVQRASLTG